jgi:hypothetical protein
VLGWVTQRGWSSAAAGPDQHVPGRWWRPGVGESRILCISCKEIRIGALVEECRPNPVGLLLLLEDGMIDPLGLSTLLFGVQVFLRLVALLIQRGVLRDRAELLRSAAALPPGTRIMVRHVDGSVVQVSTETGRSAV